MKKLGRKAFSPEMHQLVKDAKTLKKQLKPATRAALSIVLGTTASVMPMSDGFIPGTNSAGCSKAFEDVVRVLWTQIWIALLNCYSFPTPGAAQYECVSELGSARPMPAGGSSACSPAWSGRHARPSSTGPPGGGEEGERRGRTHASAHEYGTHLVNQEFGT